MISQIPLQQTERWAAVMHYQGHCQNDERCRVHASSCESVGKNQYVRGGTGCGWEWEVTGCVGGGTECLLVQRGMDLVVHASSYPSFLYILYTIYILQCLLSSSCAITIQIDIFRHVVPKSHLKPSKKKNSQSMLDCKHFKPPLTQTESELTVFWK